MKNNPADGLAEVMPFGARDPARPRPERPAERNPETAANPERLVERIAEREALLAARAEAREARLAARREKTAETEAGPDTPGGAEAAGIGNGPNPDPNPGLGGIQPEAEAEILAETGPDRRRPAAPRCRCSRRRCRRRR